MEKVKKGVRLENISKIYQDPKTGKAGQLCHPAGPFRLRQDHHAAHDRGL